MQPFWKRWSRSVISCVRRVLCGRRHTLWILLVSLLVCVVFQTFVARQARKDVSGFSLLHFTGNKPQSSYLDSFLGKVLAGSSLTLNPDLTLLHSEEVQDQNTAKTSNQISTKRNGKMTFPKSRSVSSSQSSSSLPALERCTASTHLVFLKTHKTASSTILNILYRFGESRNLTFALPANKNSQLFYPHFFAPYFVEGVTRHRVNEFHIICNHMRFKKSEVAKVMPRDTFYFSVLRNPVSMMESIFIYFKSIPAFHGKRTLDDFLNSSRTQYDGANPSNHYAHNLLAFDFGLDNNVTFESPDLRLRVSSAISAIERDFHLILISEYFDESMVLLRHALCWPLEDVVSFKLNSRSDRTRHQISPETVDKIKKWNALDWQIYLHFNATFWHRLDGVMGRRRLQEEVAELRALRTRLADLCLKDGGAVDPSKIKDTDLKPFQYGAAVIEGYNLNPDINNQTRVRCERLIMPELQYTKKLYAQQFPDVAQRQKEGFSVGKAWPRDHRHTVKRRFIDLKMPQSALSPHNRTTTP